MFYTGGDAVKMEHVRAFSGKEGLAMTRLHGIETYCARFLFKKKQKTVLI
jgi:hypothetical protein